MKRACRQIIGMALFIPVGMPLMILWAIGHVAQQACDAFIDQMDRWLGKP